MSKIIKLIAGLSVFTAAMAPAVGAPTVAVATLTGPIPVTAQSGEPYRGTNEQPVAGPGLYRVGCLGRICSFSETDDGRYLVTLAGLCRFAIAEELAGLRGYRRVRGDFGPFLGDRQPPSVAGFDRDELLAALRGYFAHRGFDANWEAIGQLNDEMLITTLAMACPFEPAEKQALLEAPDQAERAATLLALLRIDTHHTNADHVRAS